MSFSMPKQLVGVCAIDVKEICVKECTCRPHQIGCGVDRIPPNVIDSWTSEIDMLYFMKEL